MKKDKLVEEFWKWYKTVRTVNWKELGEDYFFGPKDFLTVGVLLKAVGFDKIMAYLVLKKQALRLPKNLVGASREEICAHVRSVICSYYGAYMQMVAHDIIPIYNKQIRMKYVNDRIGENFYDVYFTEEINSEQTEESYALDFIPWREVMGYQLFFTNSISSDLARYAGEILWELTFYTYEETDLEIGAEDEGSSRYIELKEKRDRLYKEYEAFRDGPEGKELTKRVYEYCFRTGLGDNTDESEG